MPRATIDPMAGDRHDLKTALPDGYVVLRRLPYEQWLDRSDMVGKMTVGGSRTSDFAGEVQMMNKKVTHYEFAHCIVDHNLEDEAGNLLDFSKPSSFAKLDPRIGNEIAELITDLHEFTRDETLPNG